MRKGFLKRLETLLRNIHEKYLSRIKMRQADSGPCHMSKLEVFFAKAANCFRKELHVRCLFDRLPKIC